MVLVHVSDNRLADTILINTPIKILLSKRPSLKIGFSLCGNWNSPALRMQKNNSKIVGKKYKRNTLRILNFKLDTPKWYNYFLF